MEVLRDDLVCPMVDRIPGTLSGQCIGQQIMLDIMDALFQLTQALFSPKGEQRLYYVNLTLKRLEDLQSNVAAMRTRTKRFEQIATEGKRPARVVTAKQYSDFLAQTSQIFFELNSMQQTNEQEAARQKAARDRAATGQQKNLTGEPPK